MTMVTGTKNNNNDSAFKQKKETLYRILTS